MGFDFQKEVAAAMDEEIMGVRELGYRGFSYQESWPLIPWDGSGDYGEEAIMGDLGLHTAEVVFWEKGLRSRVVLGDSVGVKKGDNTVWGKADVTHTLPIGKVILCLALVFEV